MPANLMSQCSAPGSSAEKKSDNISRRKKEKIALLQEDLSCRTYITQDITETPNADEAEKQVLFGT